MKYDFTGTNITEEAISQNLSKLEEYRARLRTLILEKNYDAPEAALVSIVDTEAIAKAEDIAKELGPVQHVLLMGIGGSSVGTEAVYRALETESSPILHVLDVVDSEHIEAISVAFSRVPTKELAIIIVSKSGRTTETLANADVVISLLRRVHGKAIDSRIVCISDPDTPLAQYAKERGVRFVAMPHMVGGRFSVFTVVGLIPLRLLGISIEDFRGGAADALIELASKESAHSEREESAHAASVFALRYEKGDRIAVFFAEHERLYGCAKWCEQLYAESLGKEGKRDGVTAIYGMAPIVMTPRELHSTAQLYLSGFPHVYTRFLSAEDEESSLSLSTSEYGSLISLAGSRSFDRLPRAIMEGVHRAYVTQGLPHESMRLSEISASEVGRFMAERMLEVMYIAHLFEIDAFGQPHVELYKKEIKVLLQEYVAQKLAVPEGVYLLFDIGGTKTRIATSIDLETLEATSKFSTPAHFTEGIEHIKKEMETLVKGRKVLGIAGDIRGVLNTQKTELVADSVLHDWVGKPLVKELEDTFGTKVHLENDAALVGLGEAHFGGGKGYRIVAYHTVSTGVGGARVVDGRIDTSHSGFEPGKQVIDIDNTIHPELKSAGMLEGLISGEALEKRTGKKPYETPQSDIALWDELASYLAYGIKNTIAYWSPDVIVLGGSMVVGDPRILLEDITRHTKAVLGELPCPAIVDATLKDEGGLYGAMALLTSENL